MYHLDDPLAVQYLRWVGDFAHGKDPLTARLRLWKHQHRANRANIQHHYDVSNAFFRLWLDERMVYSCAYFEHDGDTLARAQLAGEFEDLVALGQRAAPLEFPQQADGEGAAAGAGLEEARRAGRQDRFDLGRQGLGEQRREFRRGDEVAGSAELARAAAVIAEAGRVERHLHVAGEGNPAAGLLDLGGDQGGEPAAAFRGIGIGLADFTTQRLGDKLDHRPTYINCLTAMTPEKARNAADPQRERNQTLFNPKLVLGVQGNLWGERLKTFPHALYQTYPRACALAEIAWSPEPEGGRAYAGFFLRLGTHFKRLDAAGIKYRQSTQIDKP